MRKPFYYLLAAVLALGPALIVPARGADGIDLAGTWAGKLSLPAGELELVFRIERGDDGTYAARMDVPAQGATGIPVSRVSCGDGAVRLEVASINGLFEGSPGAGADEIAGAWKQNGVSLPLVLRRTAQAPALRRPQEPKPPFPYSSEEVVFTADKAGIRLAGTLTLPGTGAPFPAVILITGSGPQDRDETILGHRPFLVLADYLTRRGIAVLRVDDRGVGGSTGSLDEATTSDLADDVLAGAAYLRTRKEIDPARVGLIGHSEGGLIAPLAAVRAKDLACLVLLAAPGLPGEEIICRQTALILKAAGADDKLISRETGLQRRLFAVVKGEKDDQTARERLALIYREYLKALTDEERQALGEIEAYIAGQTRMLLTPWFRFFLTYDPIPALRQVECPVLALNGVKDLQVPCEDNLGAIEAALREGRTRDYTVKRLPDLNHLFQTCRTGHPAEYGLIEETLAPQVLETVGDWLASRFGL
ncbi:MAG: alpha/beta hydrolase family protein [Bacteroidota bacterium]